EGGIKAEMAAWLNKEGAPKLASIDKTIKSVREKIKQIAEKNLRPPTGEENKGDVAAAMLRGEVRASVRGLKPAQRVALLHDPNPDPTIIGAILEAPAALTGFTQEQLDAARERLAIAANPEAAAKVAAFNEAVEVAVNARRA